MRGPFPHIIINPLYCKHLNFFQSYRTRFAVSLLLGKARIFLIWVFGHSDFILSELYVFVSSLQFSVELLSPFLLICST